MSGRPDRMCATLRGASDVRRHATPARDARLYRPEAKKVGAKEMFHSIVGSGLWRCGAQIVMRLLEGGGGPALPVPSPLLVG